MGINIEATVLNQNFESIIHKEVTCIFCGLPTPVPAVGARKYASQNPSSISIVRCNVCGKEAPYRACDVS
jgi:hypothetical protein